VSKDIEKWLTFFLQRKKKANIRLLFGGDEEEKGDKCWEGDLGRKQPTSR